MLFNTLYGRYQQLPQPYIDVFFWWTFGACVLWFGSNPNETRLKSVTFSTLCHSLTHWQKIPIGDKSGYPVGHSLLCRKTSLVSLAACGWALVWWNMVTWPWFRNGTTSGITIPSQWNCEFGVSLTLTRFVFAMMTEFTPNQDTTTTVVVTLNDVFGMKPLNSSSPNTSTSIYKIHMKTNSSVYKTAFNCRRVQLRRVVAQLTCVWWWRWVKCTATRGLPASRLTFRKNLFLTLLVWGHV
jgi:hypothetical protein